MIRVCMHCHWFLTSDNQKDVPADMAELERLEVEVSHGLCEPCEKEHYQYPEENDA